MQARSDGYNAFEEDFAIINIYFGDTTAMGNYHYCLEDR